jgi:hypothetical protein
MFKTVYNIYDFQRTSSAGACQILSTVVYLSGRRPHPISSTVNSLPSKKVISVLVHDPQVRGSQPVNQHKAAAEDICFGVAED